MIQHPGEIMQGESSVMFSMRGRSVKNTLRGASIPTTAAAEAALSQSPARLEDFERISWTFCGNVGVQPLPPTSQSSSASSPPLCTCDRHTLQPQTGTSAITCDPQPPWLKCDSVRIAILLLICCAVSHWFPWPDLILGSHSWALIREGDAAGRRTRERVSITHSQGLKSCRFKVGSRAGRDEPDPELGSPVNCVW